MTQAVVTACPCSGALGLGAMGFTKGVLAHAAHTKAPAFAKAMQTNGPKMTPAIASQAFADLKIDAPPAVERIEKGLADGKAAFAQDNETLLLLSPLYKA